MNNRTNIKSLYYVLIAIYLLGLLVSFRPSEQKEFDPKSCSFKGLPLKGRVQFVDAFPDFTIQYVNSFADLHVKMVDNFPDDCGEWQEVTAFPDFKVKVVTSFPDVKIKRVDSFPGVP